MSYRLLVSALAAASLLAACGDPQDTRPGQPVAHRQAAFKAILKAFEPMGVMLRDDKYDGDRFLTLSKTLAANAQKPWDYFRPDTNYPPTHATGDVWSNTAKFNQERQEFVDATTRLAQVAESKDVDKIKPAYKAVHNACQECHKEFKKR